MPHLSSSPTPFFIAHVREKDRQIQSLLDHLIQTADLAGFFALAIGLPLCGRLLGLCHDLGKFSAEFLSYIRGVTGLDGEEARMRAKKKQGTIDHATAGAILIWTSLKSRGKAGVILGQLLSVAVMSHHTRRGMRDFISLKGTSPFLERLGWEEEQTFFHECIAAAPAPLIAEIGASSSRRNCSRRSSRCSSASNRPREDVW